MIIIYSSLFYYHIFRHMQEHSLRYLTAAESCIYDYLY